MLELDSLQLLLCAIVAAPGAVFLFLALVWLLGWNPREALLARLTGVTYSALCLAVAALAWMMRAGGQTTVSVNLGAWFTVHRYHFPLALYADHLSLPLIGLTVLLIGLIGAFSRRYLHRDRGFHRFFVMLHLFGFGSLLIFAAGSFDLIVGGWELVGITSVLLIAFFYERPDPVRSAIRVFATYRACDLGLLWAVFLMHHSAGSASFDALFAGPWPQQTSLVPHGATWISLLLLLAASGKSAQVPFSGWLPRAMEGPTPSSAIFYGAISIHAGAYLLLRAQPVLAASPWVAAMVVAVGLLSAVHATMVGRAAADAKTSLAYASMAQLGIIFAEIGLGFVQLALLHIMGHAMTRTLQFLRAPSMLHDYHGVHAAAGGHLQPTGSHYEAIFPARFRLWLYRLAIDRGHHDAVLDRLLVGPLVKLSAGLASIETRLLGALTEPPAEAFSETAPRQAREVAGGLDV